jgi:hypothetical protein
MLPWCRRATAALVMALASFAAAAEPVIHAAAEDDGELLIIGRDFGPAPSVRLGELLLNVNAASKLVIRAALPFGVEPGSYSLVVHRNAPPKMSSQPFVVTLGAVGPRGEKGDKGDPGMVSIDSLAGTACTFESTPGRVEVAYGPRGEIALRCVIDRRGVSAP